MGSKSWLAAVVLAATAATGPSPVDLRVVGRANATPSIAADGGLVAVVWSAAEAGGATDIFAATSRDGGASFGNPVRVNDVAGDARVSGEQPPRAAIRPSDHAIVVVWTTRGEKGTVLKQASSMDGGASFQPATLVPGTSAPGNRGWQAIALNRGGHVDAIWLDHRDLARDDAPVAASRHDHGGGVAAAGRPDGVAMAQRSKLYFGAVDASGPPTAVTGGVCYCCKTALAAGVDGTLYAAWRHVYPGNLRDIAFTVTRDGGRTFALPVRVSEDRWAIEGCPDDGPSLAVDERNDVHIVWPTLVGSDPAGAPSAASPDATIALFYARSTDGRRFTARERIPTVGLPHHPQVAIDGSGAIAIVWDESAAGTRRVVMARSRTDARGRRTFDRRIVSSGEPGVYPALSVANGTIVAAWTSGTGSTSSIRTLRVR